MTTFGGLTARGAALRRAIARFLRGDSGMTLPLLAFSLIALTGFTGLAIDTARTQMVQSKLQFSLDAAGLAAGSTVSTTNINSEVTKYLDANFNGYLGAVVTNIGVQANSTNTVFNLSATATLPTTFMTTLGIDQVTVSATSQISRSVTGLELVMVLDNTGSMSQSAGGSTSKIQALQTAANTLVNNLFGGQTTSTNGKLWVGIVPFSQAVNIGTGHPTWMNDTYDTALASMPAAQGPGWGPTSWFGCVDARQNGYDITDDPPSQSDTNTLFDQYYWPTDNINYGSPYNNTPNYNYNDWATPIYKKCTTWYGRTYCSTTSRCSPSSSTTCTLTGYNYASPLDETSRGPNLLCPQQVTPMTNDSTVLTSAINSMTAQGDTLINQGLVWGWRMLSPRWRGEWGGAMDANGLPLDYNSPGMAKAIVLVTDGENTIDDLSHGAYWFLHNGRAGSTNGTTAVNDLDAKALDVCTAMKNQGIYIYTIGLGTNGGINTAELQSCATAVNYYFASPTTDQLNTIFSAIGDSLASLRVSQ
ncbi:MAG: pilus assembly protein [Alphaproteobacteria bacterium]|nr:pilus assembly protein [Alphaproteobacteria bacterium]